MFLARHNKSAPVAAACSHKANPVNPRSASSTIPGSSRSTSSLDSDNSDSVHGPISASNMACVPHSANATTRACGNADRSPLVTPGRPKNSSFTTVSATSNVVPSIATNRRPANNDPDVAAVANGRATRSNNAFTGSNPNRSRAWKIADFDGNLTGSTPGSAHANPSVINPNTSSYEPSECNAIPTAKYAIVRAGNDRCRCSVRPDSAITSSTTSGGNTRVNNPTDTRSDNRRSESGFTQPARGIHPNYTLVVLTERYCR